MREELKKIGKNDPTNSSPAHLLNLLASDFQIPSIKEHVVHIEKKNISEIIILQQQNTNKKEVKS